MKRILILIFILVSISCNGQNKNKPQDDLYFSPNTAEKKYSTITFTNNIEKIQYCLGKYHQERKTGFILGIAGVSIYSASFIIKDSETTTQILTMIGGFVALSGIVVTLDAEKWLKRASITISPTAFKINF